MADTEERLRREAEFQDKKVTVKEEKVQQFYSKIYAGQLDAVYRTAFEEMGDLSGKTVLEMGSGEGYYALQFARRGAKVTAVDISPESIRILQAAADRESLDNITAVVANAEALEFPDDTFDLVYGSAILHHLDLAVVTPEICRVLKKGGKGVFVEPLGHNPLINLYRILTPSLRTPDEHPIVMKDFKIFRQYADKVSFRSFYLTTVFAMFWRFILPSERLFKSSFLLFEKTDRLLFSVIPLLKRFARTGLIIFQK